MTTQVIPWSYSSLTNYENCPFQYYETRITKTTPRKEFKESSDGVAIHKVIELYLRKEGPDPEPKVKELVDETLFGLDPAFFLFEHQLAVTKDQHPTGWDDEDCYHRGVIDVLHVEPENPIAHVFDWKSGKINLTSQQLKANAITVFAHYPHVNLVRTRYVWLRFGQSTPGNVYRDFKDYIWSQFIERADKLEIALADAAWPKKPSGLCRKHCPVVTCEHNGEFRRD